MTARDKAIEMWLKFDEIIARNEILDEKPTIDDLINLTKQVTIAAVELVITDRINSEPTSKSPRTAAWMLVREELENL